MKIHTRSNAHGGGVKAEMPVASDAEGAASSDSKRDAVRVVSISKTYGRHRHKVEALHDVTTSFAHDTLTPDSPTPSTAQPIARRSP